VTWHKKALEKPKSRSGTQWSETAYAEAGYGRLNLRLPQGVLDLLGKIADERGISRAALVEELVRKAAK
jgi:hypothetical protein